MRLLESPAARVLQRHISYKADEFRLPKYVDARPDVGLIGVSHMELFVEGVVLPLVQLAKARRLAREVGGMDHLIIEGSAKTFGLDAVKDRIMYETVAIDACNGEVHFLDDDDSKFLSMLQRLGVGHTKAAVLMLSGGTRNVISDNFSSGVAGEKLQGAIDDLVETISLLREMVIPDLDIPDAEDVSMLAIELYITLREKFPENPYIAEEVYRSFVIFLAINRDYLIYGPKLLELCGTLEGRKAVLMGADHLPRIQEILNGCPVTCLSWWSFKNTREPEMQAALEFVDEFFSIHAQTGLQSFSVIRP